MNILNFEFVALLALVIASITQIAKYHPRVTGAFAPFITVASGILLAFLWYLVKGDLLAKGAVLGIDWMNVYRAFSNGVVAITTATAGYVAQKAAPIPSLLPSTTEINASNIKEEVAKQELVVAAIEEGLEVEVAKDIVGLGADDPPPE